MPAKTTKRRWQKQASPRRYRTYATRDEAKRDLFSYVKGLHNRQRLHSALDDRTPDQAERQAANVA